MHYLSLVTVNIPPQEPDPLLDQKIAEQTEHLKKEIADSTNDSFFLHYLLERCNSQLTSFSRVVNEEIDSVLERYYEGTENPEYLEFFDKTEELRQNYENQKINCFKLPEGRIIPFFHSRACNFLIKDGKVFKSNSGPLQHAKRNKQAKRMKALPDYPVNKLYPTLENYAEDFYGYSYYDEQNAYGFYCNPDGIYDWYSIGGRWAYLFLVKDSCTECSIGERYCDDSTDTNKAPDGYKWVCAARKKDIEWQAMKDWSLEQAKDSYRRFEKMFHTGILEEKFHGQIMNDGIRLYGEQVYYKDESEENYLKRNKQPCPDRYPVYPYFWLDEDGYESKDCIPTPSPESGTDAISIWKQKLEEYIDSLPDDAVLVGVDLHN